MLYISQQKKLKNKYQGGNELRPFLFSDMSFKLFFVFLRKY